LTISVVIPTIGNRDLFPTLLSLNNSSIEINEIIISAPIQSKLNKIELQKIRNLKIHISKYRGQVLQRIEGFKVAKGDIIVQLDDDITLAKDCLELLYEKINTNPNMAISPNLIDSKSKRSIYDQKKGLKMFVFNKVMGLKNNETIGKITKGGFESYPVLNSELDTLLSSDWIVGGCVMHHRKNLILNSYFNFSGKAYCEDLFHSIELKKRGVKLNILPSAKAFLELNPKAPNINLFLKELKSDYRIRKVFVKENGLNYHRMVLGYFLIFLNYFIKNK
jgi:GT2 family glycosyltransferase